MVEQERTQKRPEERRRFVIVNSADAFIKKNGIEAKKLDDINITRQIRKIITSQPLENTENDQPEYLLTRITQEKFLELAKKALKSRKRRLARKYFESLVLIAPDAKTTSDTIDPTTGIRIVNIRKEAIRFQTHPTPAS